MISYIRAAVGPDGAAAPGESYVSSESDQSSSSSGGSGSPDWSPPSSAAAPLPGADPYAAPPVDGNPDAPPANPYAPPGQPYSHPGGWAGAPAPYGTPYWNGPQPPAQGTNGLAITSLVLGIIGFGCFLWALGLGFGIAALRQIRRRPQRGKGLAVAGIVLSSLWAVVVIGFVGPIAVTGFKEGWDEVGRRVDVLDLKQGECYQENAFDAERITRVTKVRCTEPHHGEVFGVVQLPGSRYPGEDEVQKKTGHECVGRQYDYALDHLAIPRGTESRVIFPERETWEVGGVTIGLCVFESKTPRVETLKQTFSALTPEQYGYLSASKELNKAFERWPEEDPEDDPARYRSWAGDLVLAAKAEKVSLDGIHWGTAAQGPVGELHADLDQLIVHAEKLRVASDPELMDEELYEISELTEGMADSELREAIDLPTSPPDDRPASV